MHPQSSRRGTLQTSKYGCGHSFLKKKKKKAALRIFYDDGIAYEIKQE